MIGFITKKFVTIHCHMNVKKRCDLLTVKYYCKIIEFVPGVRATVLITAIAICILQYYNYRSDLF